MTNSYNPFTLEVGFNSKTKMFYIQKYYRTRKKRFLKKYETELEAYKACLRHSNAHTCVGFDNE